jgi:hypothetical protein
LCWFLICDSSICSICDSSTCSTCDSLRFINFFWFVILLIRVYCIVPAFFLWLSIIELILMCSLLIFCWIMN